MAGIEYYFVRRTGDTLFLINIAVCEKTFRLVLLCGWKRIAPTTATKDLLDCFMVRSTSTTTKIHRLLLLWVVWQLISVANARSNANMTFNIKSFSAYSLLSMGVARSLSIRVLISSSKRSDFLGCARTDWSWWRTPLLWVSQWRIRYRQWWWEKFQCYSALSTRMFFIRFLSSTFSSSLLLVDFFCFLLNPLVQIQAIGNQCTSPNTSSPQW